MSIYKSLCSGQAALAVVGLGYVGMPLALMFAEKVKTIGYDINVRRVEAYQKGIDYTNEVGSDALKRTACTFTADEEELKKALFIIIATPTPVSDDNLPDLTYLKDACQAVGRNLSRGAIVVVESTVYSGVTEDVCAPQIEEASGLVCGRDFWIGYSPERINPGDKVHRLDNIVKIVAGMNEQTSHEISEVYKLIVRAGTFQAKSIKAAELAKLEENAQRDINIAFMNEMSMIHEKLGVDTADVLAAMNTKWNALGFTPGLVGGHCISVDPYYLLYKAGKEKCHSTVVQAGRRINNDMADFVADAVIKRMIEADQMIKRAKVYIFGVTFKENCPDIRNSLVVKIIQRLNEYGVSPLVVDMYADKEDTKAMYGIDLVDVKDVHDADCLVFAVAHEPFADLQTNELQGYFSGNTSSKKVIADLKNIFSRDYIEKLGYVYWCL